MAITLEPVTLEAPPGDEEAVLARCNGRLFAILSRLGGMHDELIGHWYVETVFSTGLVDTGQMFRDLEDFEKHVADQESVHVPIEQLRSTS